MVDIQSATVEIRRGKKIEETTGPRQKCNGVPITMDGHNMPFGHVQFLTDQKSHMEQQNINVAHSSYFNWWM